ncbi:MAG: sugar ABC transporter permease [Actinobacteria bacterium]|nr:sugar ABC transporter permease [Actinomycetota bacterium]
MRKNFFPGFVLIPVLIWISIFIFYPLLYSIWASLHLWVPEKPWSSVFIGLNNYIKLFSNDPKFIVSIKNTFIYVGVKTVAVVVIGIAIALLLNQVRKLQKYFIYSIFLPFLCPASAIGILFLYFYQPTFGLFNSILNVFNIPTQNFLSNASQAIYCVIAADVWQTVGFSTLIFFTGLTSMPDTFLEAARVDGAGPFRTFFNITLPLLGDTFLFIIVYTMINAFQVFDFIFVMTATGGGTGGATGGPGISSYVLSLMVYNEGMLRMQVDKGASVSIIMFIIILVLSIFQYKILKPKWEY